MFPSGSPGGSELDAVSASVSQNGLESVREKWECHWKNAVREQDFEWLVTEGKCTSIRLPIGYFTLGEAFCKGTPFERVGGVYVNAWREVKEFVRRARAWGIGVLVDLHAVPSGGLSCFLSFFYCVIMWFSMPDFESGHCLMRCETIDASSSFKPSYVGLLLLVESLCVDQMVYYL
jgi:hypothetical protein